MRIAVPVALFAGILCAQEVSVTRQGPYWVRTTQGTVGAAKISRLRVSTQGRVVLRGAPGDKVTYQLIERVRAFSEADAQRKFSAVKSVARGHSDAALFVSPVSREQITELQVGVPASVTVATVETRLGDVEAYDLEGSVEAGTTAGLLRCDRIHGGVVGRTGGGEIRLGKIAGPVRCLSGGGSIFIDDAGSETSVQTAGGEIVVRESAGPLTLSTEGGNIRVAKAGGSVEAHSAGGLIEVAQAGGVVVADTRGGSIQIGSAQGVRAETGAGAIRVKTSATPLHLATAMGSILAELLTGTHLEDASLFSGSGDVTVLIPANLALSVRARNESGGNPRIVSDFSEVRNANIGFVRPPLVAEGAINGGGPVLRINVAGGTIYLRRLK